MDLGSLDTVAARADVPAQDGTSTGRILAFTLIAGGGAFIAGRAFSERLAAKRD